MNDLRRSFAPISGAAWKAIDDEARKSLSVILAARRIVDFSGPLGWSVSSVELGRTQELPTPPQPGVTAALRRVQRLIELRAPFELSRRELDSLERGAKDPDVEALRQAALAIGVAEDKIIFHGYPEAEIQGIFEVCAGASLTLTRDYSKYPTVVSEALSRLRTNGVGGPYAIALGPDCYKGLTGTTTSAGYPVLAHVQRLVDGPVFWAPGIQGALVASLRGGDFELAVGRDFSVGYEEHTASKIRLYLEESLTFRVLAAEAAIPLVYR
jgi:uncharacterized linocin/CFP29 family protein